MNIIKTNFYRWLRCIVIINNFSTALHIVIIINARAVYMKVFLCSTNFLESYYILYEKWNVLSIYDMISTTISAVDLNKYHAIFQKCFLKIKFY